MEAYKGQREQRIGDIFLSANWTAAAVWGKLRESDLDKVLKTLRKPPEPETPESMLDKIKKLNAQFGGKEVM